MTTTWHLVDHIGLPMAAADQMVCDLALLEEVGRGGGAALRLYTWSAPALSLGRFQAENEVDARACSRRGVEVVRRPTGGRALLHGGDLTYAVAFRSRSGVDETYRWIAGALTSGLARLGVDAEVAEHRGETGSACFASSRGADLRVGSRKLCGSAQVRRGQAILQHGAILLHRLEVDECDLLAFPSPRHRRRARHDLATATVTLSELGAPTDPRIVGDALRTGFEDSLDLKFRSKLVAAGQGRQ